MSINHKISLAISGLQFPPHFSVAVSRKVVLPLRGFSAKALEWSDFPSHWLVVLSWHTPTKLSFFERFNWGKVIMVPPYWDGTTPPGRMAHPLSLASRRECQLRPPQCWPPAEKCKHGPGHSPGGGVPKYVQWKGFIYSAKYSNYRGKKECLRNNTIAGGACTNYTAGSNNYKQL